MGKVTNLVTAAIFGLVGNLALAAPNNITPAEQHLLSKGVQIVQTFPSASGMKAIVADNGKEKRLFYVTPDGKNLVVGMVFDSSGNNITSQDMNRAGVADVGGAKTLSDAQLESFWARAEKLNWIAEGTGKKILYVFFDPNCPYCHRLWTTLRDAVQSGKVQVRWLPVAILKESSKGLSAAIYASKNPAQVLGQMVNYQLQPINVSDAANKSMAHNLLLLRDTGYTGVPTILYKQDGKIRAVMGSPETQDLALMTR